MSERPPTRPDESRPGPTMRAAAAARGRVAAAVLSTAFHVALIAALLFARVEPPRMVEVAPPTVFIVFAPPPVPKPPPPPKPKPPTPKPSPAKPPPPPSVARRSPAPPRPDSLPAAKTPKVAAVVSLDTGSELSAGQIAGAGNADSGPPGGACNMAKRVQDALRKDPLVRAAVVGQAGKATLVWNGDWVRGHGEDGKGLAAVREAILWEVGFAPEACRHQSVHGLIVLSVNGAGGATRLALGAGDWRWSDVLRMR